MTLSQGAEIDPGVHADSDTHLRQAVTPSEARERGSPATQELWVTSATSKLTPVTEVR